MCVSPLAARATDLTVHFTCIYPSSYLILLHHLQVSSNFISPSFRPNPSDSTHSFCLPQQFRAQFRSANSQARTPSAKLSTSAITRSAKQSDTPEHKPSCPTSRPRIRCSRSLPTRRCLPGQRAVETPQKHRGGTGTSASLFLGPLDSLLLVASCY